jgi:Flp pilus assembly protein TadG
MSSGTSDDRQEPRGLAALRHLLVDDESGSAAVEFIVLIPIYLLMICALFSISQLMLVRQSVVAAARYEAWSSSRGGGPSAGTGVKDAFFGTLVGTWSAQMQSNADVALTLQNANAKGGKIAQMVLDNAVSAPGGGGAVKPLRQVEVKGTFNYTGISPIIGVTRAFAISTVSAVVLTNPHDRPVFKDGQTNEHAMLSSSLGRNSRQFDPIGQNGYLSPIINPTFTRDQGGDPGIWNRDARINGTAQSEHGFYGPGGRRRP